MTLKKLLIASIMVITVLLVAVGTTSCNLMHEHSFSAWETVTEPTCTAFGLQKRVCECGHVEYGAIDAVAHTPITDAGTDATCSTPGKTEGSHCGVCNTVITAQTATPTLSHSFSEWEIVTEPTCTAFGLQKRTCTCGHVDYDTTNVVAHTPVIDAAVAATCTTLGKTEGSHCGACGMILVAQIETETLSHSFSAWQTVSEPTCTAFGLQKRTCACGYVDYDTKNALGHVAVVDAAVAATCTTFGKTEGSHCEACGLILAAQSAVAPTGHNCDEITILEEAVCNFDGSKRFSCSNADCSYYYDESYSLPTLDSNEIYNTAVQYVGTLQIFSRYGEFIQEASAFVIDAGGIILTSNYRIDNAFSAIFILGGNEYAVTQVLAYSEASSMAVLKIDATDLPSANLCMRDPVNAETIYSVGAPGGWINSISCGVISNTDRELYGIHCIQHDADMNAGYAGGPLVNRYGEVIGMNVGYLSAENLSLAVRISELYSLDYSNPISFEEYGNITYTPIEQLSSWVVNNYNGTTDNAVAYVIQGNGFYYSLGYDTVNQYSFAEGYWIKEGNYQLYVRIIFDNAAGIYQYYATLTDGMIQNEAYGYIDAANYTASTVLTYDTFYGKYWTESELMSLYSTAVYDTLGWFSYCLDTYFNTLTLETFGFTQVSYDRDADALNKLNAFVMTVGTFNESTGAYELSMSSPDGDHVAVFNITYIPQNGDIAASTVATLDYYMANGVLFHISLSLDPTENGNRFEFAYAVYNGTEFIVQNVAWGYLDAASLTNASKLTCYVFNGMNEYEDGLLLDYTSYLAYLMTWMDYIMPNVSPELSIKDLGFLFYFD